MNAVQRAYRGSVGQGRPGVKGGKNKPAPKQEQLAQAPDDQFDAMPWSIHESRERYCGTPVLSPLQTQLEWSTATESEARGVELG